MSKPQGEEIDKQQHDELCCTYAALILHDEKIEITTQQLKKVIEASGNKVDAFWPSLFAKALAGININSLMSGSSASAPPIVSSSAAPPAAAPEKKKEEKPAAKKEEPKKEEAKEEQEDMDMGDLFAF